VKIEKVGEKFVITDFDAASAYRIACNVEREGVAFYKKLAGVQTKPEIKDVLDFLLSEEEKHLKFFEKQYVDAVNTVDDYNEDEDIINSMDFEVFKPYSEIKGFNDYLTELNKVFNLGVIVEENSINFYTACLDKIEDIVAKVEIKKIIKEERKHKEMIEQLMLEI